MFLLILLLFFGAPAHQEHIDMKAVVHELPFENPDGGAWKQGWKYEWNNNDENAAKVLNVFVVPHSHNDPGWLKTFEDYYQSKTKGILNSVFRALDEDHNRHFIWAEISFFSRWWQDIDATMKNTVRAVIERGQLEFVTGGWVMNDEATSYYYSILVQLYEGHNWLQEHLNYKPVYAWSIDPFGHSPVQAFFYNLTGFQAMLIQRIHYAIKKELALKKSLEFMWRPTWRQLNASENDILTHMMPFFSYDIPHTCGPDPSVCSQYDFTKQSTAWGGRVAAITDSNLKEKSLKLLNEFRKKSMLYRTKSVLVPLGDDFMYYRYEDIHNMLSNHQLIHKYLNEHSDELKVNVKLATLSQYFQSVQQQATSAHVSFPTLSGDFFTYADKDADYWSGYFTSRPFFKHKDRILESKLRNSEILHAFYQMLTGNTNQEYITILENSRRALALFQHHDGITGTAKPWVVEDYGKILDEALWNLHSLIPKLFHAVLAKDRSSVNTNERVKSTNERVKSTNDRVKSTNDRVLFAIDEQKTQYNEIPMKSVLGISVQGAHAVVQFNSLTSVRTEVVTVRISSPSVRVIDTAGNQVQFEIHPVWRQTSDSLQIAKDEFQLVFLSHTPPMGFSTYFIEFSKNSLTPANVADCTVITKLTVMDLQFLEKDVKSTPVLKKLQLSNDVMKVTVDGPQGLIESISIHNDEEVAVQEEYITYDSTQSGAYLFLPTSQQHKQLSLQSQYVIVTQGQLMQQLQLHSHNSPLLSRYITLYAKEDDRSSGIEIVQTVSLTAQMERKEIAVKYSSSIASDSTFYTDLNGFQMQQRRVRKDRPIQHNYYPMTSTLYIQDSKYRMSINSRQSMGVSSLQDGSVELILDRRVPTDDQRGLGQGITDNVPTPVHLFLSLEKVSQNSRDDGYYSNSMTSHSLSLRLNNPLLTVYAADVTPTSWTDMFDGSYSLSNQLPPELHIITLRGRRDSSIALQLLKFPIASHDTSSLRHTSKISLPLKEMFPCVKTEGMDEKSLTFMHHIRHLKSEDPVNLSPYHIRSFLFNATIPTQCQYSHTPVKPVTDAPVNHVKDSPSPIKTEEKAPACQPSPTNSNSNVVDAALQQQIQRLQKELGAVKRELEQEKNKSPSAVYYYALLSVIVVMFAGIIACGGLVKRHQLILLAVVILITTTLPLFFFKD